MRDHIFQEEGMPKVVFSDRGPQFVSAFMKELYRLLGVKGNPSTAYHPQTDGQSERMNREIERYLRTYISYHQDDWEEWLAIGEFAYNNGVHAATGHTPFYLNKGRHPGDHPDALDYNDRVPAAEEVVKAAIAAREHAKIALAKAKEAMKRRVNKKRGLAIEYEDGQKVWVSAEHLKSNQPLQKLDDKWHGPFKIVKKVGSAAYELEMPPNWWGRHTFNRDRLKPYTEPKYQTQKDERLTPPAELIDDFEEYEVEAVLAKRTRVGRTEYLVCWKGYSPENDTWEPIENLKNAQQAIKTYEARGRAKGKGGHNVRIFSLASEADNDRANRLSKPMTRDDNYDEDYNRGRWQHTPSSSGTTTSWKYEEYMPPLKGTALIDQKIEALRQHPHGASPLSRQARNATAVKTPGLIRLSAVTGPVPNPCRQTTDPVRKEPRPVGLDSSHANVKKRPLTILGPQSSSRLIGPTNDATTTTTPSQLSSENNADGLRHSLAYDKPCGPPTSLTTPLASAPQTIPFEKHETAKALHVATSRKPIDYQKVSQALRHLLVVLHPSGVESLDGETLTPAERQAAAERLRNMGVSVYIV